MQIRKSARTRNPHRGSDPIAGTNYRNGEPDEMRAQATTRIKNTKDT